MPSSARQEAGQGWPSGGGALPGCRWGADGLDKGVRMWSHPFLLGKEGREVREGPGGPGWGREGRGRRSGEGHGEESGEESWTRTTSQSPEEVRQARPQSAHPAQVAVFLVDTGDAMSPELSRETRTKLCALITMLSSYQVRRWDLDPGHHAGSGPQSQEWSLCQVGFCVHGLCRFWGCPSRKGRRWEHPLF